MTAWTPVAGISGLPGALLTPTQTYGNTVVGTVVAETGAELS
jgi:hypothetical protein